MYCFFSTDFVPLGPVKEEEVYLQPRIVLYHGLISDAEIDTIKVCQLDTTFPLLYAYIMHRLLSGGGHLLHELSPSWLESKNINISHV